VVASGKEATVYLYDAIVSSESVAEWWGGVAAETLAKEIRALNVDTIHLRINSPGGDVFAGRFWVHPGRKQILEKQHTQCRHREGLDEPIDH
jgi:hypothetical protein